MDDFQIPPAKKLRVDYETPPLGAPLRHGQDDHNSLDGDVQDVLTKKADLDADVDLNPSETAKAVFSLPGIGPTLTHSATNSELRPTEILSDLVSVASDDIKSHQAQSLQSDGGNGDTGEALEYVGANPNNSSSMELEETDHGLDLKEVQDMNKESAISRMESNVSQNEASVISSSDHEKNVANGLDAEKIEREETGISLHNTHKGIKKEDDKQDKPSATTSVLNGQGEPRAESLDVPMHSPGSTEQANSLVNTKVEGHEAEFEYDSSPYESSSSDSSSSDSSSDDDSDDDYQMLDPAEQARRLMEDDGGSDDEGAKKGGANNGVRTLNEKPDEVVELPDIEVTQEMKIEELGNIETIVGTTVLIKAKVSGEYRVLETASLLCLEDRKVVGIVSETLGRVEQPRYCVRFTNVEAILKVGLSIDKTIYYVPEHSTFVFTKALKSIKGSDASNIHDEEVGADEIEFSDDEAEAEYKRTRKLEKQARRGGRSGSGAGSIRGSHLNQHMGGSRRIDHDGKLDHNITMKYEDDSNADEPYTPLSRPSNLHEMMIAQGSSATEHSQEGYSKGARGARGGGNRHRGGARGRGERRGGFQNQRHPLPPVPNFGQLSMSQLPSLPQNPYQAFSSSASQAPHVSRDTQYSPENYQAQQYEGQAAYQGYANTQPSHQPNYEASQQPNHQQSYPSSYQQSYHPNHPPNYNAMQYSHVQPNQQTFHQHAPLPAQMYPLSTPVAGNPTLPPGAFVNPSFFPSHVYPQPPSHLGPATGQYEANRR